MTTPFVLFRWCGFFLLGLGLIPLSFAKSADTTVCTKGELRRQIAVHYPTEQPLPCEVHYQKGAHVEILWRAQITAGYCQQQAYHFILKQQQWGWQCQVQVPNDEMAVLAPTQE